MIQNELSFNNFHKNRDDLYRVTVKMGDSYWSSSSWALQTRLKKDYPVIVKGSWYYQRSVNTRYKDKNFNERIVLVSDEFYSPFL